MRQAGFRPPFLGPSPCGANSAILNRAAWSLRVLPNAVVASGQQASDQYSETPTGRIKTATTRTI